MISAEVKQHVTFSRLNLLDESKLLFMKGNDDHILRQCADLFRRCLKRRTVHHFYNSLLPGIFLSGPL